MKATFTTWRVMVALVALAGVAGGARAETLQQALSDAWHNNPRLAAARAGESAAKSDVRAAKGEWYPKLGLQAQIAREHTTGKITFFNPPSSFDADLNQASLALRLDQPLYQGGRISSDISVAENKVSASRAQTGERGSDVLLNAVKAYLDVFAAQKLLAVQQENVGVIGKRKQAAHEALKHGEGTNTDVSQAESRLQGAIAARIRAQSELAQMRALYRTVVGHAPGKLAIPTRLPRLPATLARAETLANQDYAVRAAEFNARAASDQAKVTGAATMPQLGLFAEVRREREPQYGFEQLNDEQIGVSLSFPIWRGGTLRAKSAAAHKRAHQAALEVRAAKDQAQGSVVAAWHDYAAARAAFGADKSRLSAARTAYKGVLAQHRHGERTLLDVLNAEQETRNAKAALIQARRDRIVAAYALLAATGQLSANSLRLAGADRAASKP